ncbi:hypothetical protein [Paenibacillus apiarius]|uniref:hypothetical protein n=1 Tax=Paenibacillus apiarius TaxID=46240 RepID=UPI00197D650C|nr:hypothetical protein [Paenibacillus apiarius]MBN3525604.1 hypothetical protein [Paenibacillus apiarius]
MLKPKKAKNPELAKEFIKFQYRDDSIKLNAEKTTGIVAVKNAPGLVKDFVPESVYNSIKVFEEGVIGYCGGRSAPATTNTGGCGANEYEI